MAKAKKLKEEDLIAIGRGAYDNSISWRETEVVPRWKKSNDLYNAVFATDEKAKSNTLIGQGRLFIPKTYSHLQRMHVDVMGTFFFDPEEIADVVSWKSIPAENRMLVKTLLNYRLTGHPINFYQEVFEATLDAMKNKVGVLKIYPELETDEFGNIIKYVPHIECVPYEDVLFDPKATWKDYWKFTIIHRMVKTRDYLKRKGYKNIDQLQPVYDEAGTDEIKLQRQFTQQSPFTKTVKVPGADRLYIFEIWTHLDIDGDGYLEPCKYVMGGGEGGPEIVISDVDRNDLPDEAPPFVAGVAFPEAHKLYGKDLPEIVEGLQRETNAIRNQRREAVALALRKPILVNRSANLDLVSLVNRRIGSVVLGDDISPQSVRELDISDPTAGSLQEQMKTDQDFYETTSIPPNLLGMPSSADETATAVTSHTANANKKIEQLINNLAQTLIIPTLKKFLALEQTYESDEFIQLVTGRILGWGFANDGLPARDYIQGEFDLTVNIGMNKQIQLNKLLLIMDRANIVNQGIVSMVSTGVVAPQDVHFVNPMAIFHRILPLLGEKNIEEFMTNAQQPPPEMQGAGGKGVASQTGMDSSGSTQFGMNNLEALSGLGIN